MSARDLESAPATSFVGKPAAELQPASGGALRADKTAGPDTVYKIAIVDSSDEFPDPSPLGFFAFSISTFMLGFLAIEATPASYAELVAPLVLFNGGLAQIIAGLFEFVKKNQYGAVCFITVCVDFGRFRAPPDSRPSR